MSELKTKKRRETKEEKIQKSDKVNSSIDSVGTSRVYIMQKRSNNLKEYFGDTTTKNERVSMVNDFIFNKSSESGLEDINTLFNNDIKALNNKVAKIVQREKK